MNLFILEYTKKHFPRLTFCKQTSTEVIQHIPVNLNATYAVNLTLNTNKCMLAEAEFLCTSGDLCVGL